MLVYLNGNLVQVQEAKVSVFDRGFLYGDGLFETLRAYSGRPFREKAHIKRLRKGLALLKIPCPPEEKIRKAIYEVIEKNHLKDAYVRVTVSRGICKRGPVPRECEEPTLFCYAEEFNGLSEDLYKRGVSLGLPKRTQWRLPEEAYLKALSFLPNIIDRLYLSKEEFDIILLDPQGFISETTVSNIFFVRDGTVFTPSQECSPLLGITREVVVELSREAGLTLVEGRFRLQDLLSADEVFITNSLIEVMPVHKIGERTYPVGPVTGKIMQLYRQKVREETLCPDS